MQRRSLFLLVLVILFLLPVNGFAEDISSDSCTAHRFKKGDAVTPSSLTHRPKSKTVLYDDMFCGLQWRDKQCTTAQLNFDSNAKVYDFYTSDAVIIGEAVFVQINTSEAAMGHGIVAFANNEDAEKFLAEKGSGEKIPYQEILQMDAAQASD